MSNYKIPNLLVYLFYLMYTYFFLNYTGTFYPEPSHSTSNGFIEDLVIF